MGYPIVLEPRNDDPWDDHGYPHDHAAPNKHRLTTKFVNHGHGWERADKENNARDAGRKEGLSTTRQSQADEDIGSVVDDGIDARPLLEEHDEPGSGDTLEVVLGADYVPVLGAFADPDISLLLSCQLGEVLREGALLE